MGLSAGELRGGEIGYQPNSSLIISYDIHKEMNVHMNFDIFCNKMHFVSYHEGVTTSHQLEIHCLKIAKIWLVKF